MFVNISVKACYPDVGTYEHDYITPKQTFFPGEIIYGKGMSKVHDHYKLRIRDPSDNVTYYSNPVYDKKISCSWQLYKDAQVGEWDIQKGTFYEGSWRWECTTNFEVTVLVKYTLTININSLGTVIKYPDQKTYVNGTLVNLKAIDIPGWTFDHWSGDLTHSENPTIIHMTSDKTVTAHFHKENNIEGNNSERSPNGGEIKDTDNREGLETNDAENLAPVAKLVIGDLNQIYVNSEILFNGSLSYDPDGHIISWRWDFGDGNFDTGEITSYRYQNTGKYNITLMVTDNDGLSNISEISMQVIQPINNFSTSETSILLKNDKNIKESKEYGQPLFVLTLLAWIPIVVMIVTVPLIFIIQISKKNVKIIKKSRKKTKH
jgi:uncharacterized repeat protein (TIGR02543 family)